jgi:hypothetical protein
LDTNFKYKGAKHALNDHEEAEVTNGHNGSEENELDDEELEQQANLNNKNNQFVNEYSSSRTHAYEAANEAAAAAAKTDLNLKFTIDLNTLKADMKKKSAKLLSKLSVNSTNCNLVKSLAKQENGLSMTNGKEDQQSLVPAALISNESLELKLKVEGNFNLSAPSGALIAQHQSLNHINSLANVSRLIATEGLKLNTFIENYDEAEYDWFNAIEFKFDAVTGKSSQFQELASFLQKKIFERQEKNRKSTLNETARYVMFTYFKKNV